MQLSCDSEMTSGSPQVDFALDCMTASSVINVSRGSHYVFFWMYSHLHS